VAAAFDWVEMAELLVAKGANIDAQPPVRATKFDCLKLILAIFGIYPAISAAFLIFNFLTILPPVQDVPHDIQSDAEDAQNVRHPSKF
jgi:hypothetical protein